MRECEDLIKCVHSREFSRLEFTADSQVVTARSVTHVKHAGS